MDRQRCELGIGAGGQREVERGFRRAWAEAEQIGARQGDEPLVLRRREFRKAGMAKIVSGGRGWPPPLITTITSGWAVRRTSSLAGLYPFTPATAFSRPARWNMASALVPAPPTMGAPPAVESTKTARG